MTLFNCKPARRIASGFHPDPTICRAPSGRYFLVNSSFEYFPGLPIYESGDGKHWALVGNAMDRPSQFPCEGMGNSGGIYAPTLRWHDGLFYLIVTNVNKGTMIMTTPDPHQGWSDPLWITGWPGIDPTLLFDDDGTVYICGNESDQVDQEGEREVPGIYLSRLDVGTGTVLSKRERICGGITGANPEGPHMYKRDGLYYLMWAEGGTEAGHMENMARSASPTGPYEMCPGNPLITNRSTHLTLQAIGHCDCAGFDEDRTLMVFHGTRNNHEYPAQGWLGRESYAVWFAWKDGWPTLADQSYDVPLLGEGEALEDQIDWITPSLDRAGRFSVTGSGDPTAARILVEAADHDFGLDDGAPMIGTRQTDFRCTFEATLPDPAQLTCGQAGLAVYANAGHYMDLSVQPAHNGLVHVQVQVHNAGLVSLVGSADLPAGAPIGLEIRGDEMGYAFRASGRDGDHDLGHAPGKVLSFTNAGGFTGILLGVYAHGSGQVAFDPVAYRV